VAGGQDGQDGLRPERLGDGQEAGDRLRAGDVVTFLEADTLTWSIAFLGSQDTSVVLPQAGDYLYLHLEKPFSDLDRFAYTNREARLNGSAAHDQLANVRVVPNPYLAGASWEPRPLVTGTRGERRIQFQGLPPHCTIRIYTIRGELVQTLEHHAGVLDGSLDWDLRSRDGLDIAYGVYIYHLDSPVGEKVGKFAVIK
jgi:hypothetical protein